ARAPIYEDTQHTAAPGLYELDVDQLELERLDRRLQQANQGLPHSSFLSRSGIETHAQTKKGTIGPLSSNEKGPTRGLSLRSVQSNVPSRTVRLRPTFTHQP